MQENVLRFDDNSKDIMFDPFVVTTGSFEPGHAKEFCEAVKDSEKNLLAEAELTYYKGNPVSAFKQMEKLTSSENSQIVAAGLVGSSICSISSGDMNTFIDLHKYARELSEILDVGSPLKKMTDFISLYFNILIRNSADVSLPPFGRDAFSVCESLKPMAFYIYSQYLLSIGDTGRGIGMAEGALIFMKERAPISEIYLSLTISIGYINRNVWDKADYYFLHAWSLAQEDELIMPFAEYRGMLCGMVEKHLKHRYPKIYKKILALSKVYYKNWVFLHNFFTGDKLSGTLTANEYNVASLASKQLSNTEIAERLGISVNSVRSHMRNIFNKLGIEKRKELEEYVI